jgi:hypothetical protein
MNRLTLDINQLLANVDLVPFFVITSGIILFWVLMVWCVLLLIKVMDH